MHFQGRGKYMSVVVKLFAPGCVKMPSGACKINSLNFWKVGRELGPLGSGGPVCARLVRLLHIIVFVLSLLPWRGLPEE